MIVGPKFSSGGQECGWLKDKYGLSWQNSQLPR